MNTSAATKNNDIRVIRAQNLACTHGFSTRTGGVSEGVYASLNLGLNRGDNPDKVKENWQLFASAVGLIKDGEEAMFVSTQQVHGNRVAYVTEKDLSIAQDGFQIKETDGLVTDKPKVALTVWTADCHPVLLHDPQAHVIAALHCGWKSTVADIMKCGIAEMTKLGADPSRIRVAIGPGIRKCCFETHDEVPRAIDELIGADVAKQIGAYELTNKKTGQYHCDLAAVIACRLEQLGIPSFSIETLGECTCCHPKTYYSHRVSKGGDRGSLASIIRMD
ncbi:MAG: peptidoglycan editing factor PgeF [Eggerthellaceae bacterium]|nr:peptidoglycan editing factor PgeF [Eggerthellaceae bacterium]